MAFNLFDTPDYYTGLLGEEATQKLQNKALGTGLVNAALAFIAQPRNQRYGSALPYLGKALMGGYQAGQDVIQGGLRDYETQQKIAEMQRKKEQQAALQGMIGGIQDPNERLFAQLAPEQYVTSKLKPKERKFEKVGNQLIDVTAETPNVVYTAPDKEELKVVGNSLVDSTGKVIYTAPTKQDLPTSAQEYEYAQRNPAYAKFLETRDKSKATTINLPSESERTSGFLTSRLQNALGQINQVVSKNPNAAIPQLGAEAVKLFTGSDYLKNLTNPATRQQVEAAQLELLDSALTLGTGAAYTREQLMNYQKSYFPQLGDKPNTIADKQERLKALLNAAKIKAGRAAPEDLGLPPGVTVERVK